MRYKALVSFAGAVTMSKGEIRNLTDSLVVSDLLEAKYIAPVETKKKTTETKK